MCVFPAAQSYALNNEENKDYQPTCFETAVKEIFWISVNSGKIQGLEQRKKDVFLFWMKQKTHFSDPAATIAEK